MAALTKVNVMFFRRVSQPCYSRQISRCWLSAVFRKGCCICCNMAVPQHPEFHVLVLVFGQLLLMFLRPFLFVCLVFLFIWFCFPHRLHGVIVLRDFCLSFQF